MTCPAGTSQPTTMRFTILSPLGRPFCSLLVAASMAAGVTSAVAQQQAPPPPRPAQTVMPSEAQTPAPAASRRGTLPQGFSVVLVLGDIQGATSVDDVPPAARKALTDMRDFLPFKSYKLLDAAWLMCCSTGGQGSASQMLRGPEDVEYELRLDTARFEGSRVSVRFSLRSNPGAVAADAVAMSSAAALRSTERRLANLMDQRALIDKQIGEARKKVEVGVAPATDVAKLELELRRVEREIQEVQETAVHAANSRATANTRGARGSAGTPTAYGSRSTIIDTNFTMDVGETVVVGTSRLKGGSRALIALLTAVPPRGTTEKRE
jgi:hypothetical protein